MADWDDILDARTQRRRRRPAAAAIRTGPVLTIAYHPDHRRIGERARLSGLLAGKAAEISRKAPLFGPPGERARTPLADPFVSRQAVALTPSSGDIVVERPAPGVEISIDGARQFEARTLSSAEIERGVTIELSDRVVLLLHRAPPETGPAADLGLIGASPGVEQVRRDILSVADTSVNVLIRGETGSGKELVAAGIHAASPRAGRRFVAANMAAIAPSVAASELFGHVRGAFTGASTDRPGLFLRADGGTLFLDEIGETPPEIQTMMLRALETQEINAVGSRRPQPIDVRVLSATDADLETLIGAGGFRAPLLHRLSGFEIELPPLRARRDDIPRLFLHFFAEFAAELGIDDRLALEDPFGEAWLPAGLFVRLLNHPWPGNVRELRNAAQKIAISSRESDVVVPDRLFAPLPAETAPQEAAEPPPAANGRRRRYRKPDEVTEAEVVAGLRDEGWHVGRAAERLGVSRTTMYGLMEGSSLIRKAKDLSDEELRAAWAETGGKVGAMAAMLEVSARGLKLRLRAFTPPAG